MLFVKTEDLKVGMRLGRPIYNKNGVLLYERNSKLSHQGVISVHNFGLIGLYILEPAEPVPPMSKEDLDFERFQTMAVFAMQEEMDYILSMQKTSKIQVVAATIIKAYGHRDKKINFIQNLRSQEDYIYKHSLNAAILCALMSNALHLKREEQLNVVMAAIVYDIGELAYRKLDNPDKGEKEERYLINRWREQLDSVFAMRPNIKRICVQCAKTLADDQNKNKNNMNILIGTKILMIAETFDTMTAMRFGVEPSSEVKAMKHLLDNSKMFEPMVVNALIASIRILGTGTCVELTTREKGLVLVANEENILKPIILCFKDNRVIDLALKANQDLEIVDIMKTLDNRHVMDMDTLRAQGIMENPDSDKVTLAMIELDDEPEEDDETWFIQ